MLPDLILFALMGWLLMVLGVALAVRSFRETRGITPEFPRDDEMRMIMRFAFGVYLFLLVGHSALTVAQFQLTNPLQQVVVLR